jgi:beta-N-acetylhexosaminidase
MLSQLFKLAIAVVTTAACFGFASAKDLTLEEKVGQLLMVHFHGETANEEAQVAVQELHVGSIIYYNWANGLNSPEQVARLSSGLQTLARIPLIIAVDQEGGRVVRLIKGFTPLPANKALGMTGRPALARANAYTSGGELLAVGVNMNLAPVVDVDSNPENPVIGPRSFGNTPELVISFGREALAGCRRAGVISCLKHFPGHGDTSTDSHESLPVVDKSLEELEKVELLPFATLANEADAIMTAHLLVPALDLDHCSTLSKKTLDYLRDRIGFQGVILSDSLVMEGVLKKCGGSIDEAAIQALSAGCDILILGGKQLTGTNHLELTIEDVRRIHSQLVLAVKSGRISEEALDRSVDRILQLKKGLR